ncbi:unnamed protein product, partial [Prorocentrum cordatum]
TASATRWRTWRRWAGAWRSCAGCRRGASRSMASRAPPRGRARRACSRGCAGGGGLRAAGGAGASGPAWRRSC